MEKHLYDILDNLIKWSEKQRFAEKAIKSCRQALKKYVREQQQLNMISLHGFSIDDIRLKLDQMSYSFIKFSTSCQIS